LKIGDGSTNRRSSMPLGARADTVKRRIRLLPQSRVVKVVSYRGTLTLTRKNSAPGDRCQWSLPPL
jgi:hypothetical protein